MREAKELLLASKEYAREHRFLSWWHLGSTLFVFALLLVLTILPVPLGLRIAASVLLGLVHVRLFIIYHDFQHHAILRGSRLATCVMTVYGLIALNPRSVWNRSHNHHHKHNAKIFGASIGSYPVMTTEVYAEATWWERLQYTISRHPLTMALGYLTIFLYGMCLRPFLLNPKKHFDAGLSILLHAFLVVSLALLMPQILVLSILIPHSIAAAIGAYLFYAQHNYPSVKLRERSDWTYVDAALQSSSFIKMGPLMNWFTGNIGYHHVHHLNALIPFYRLPEAMAGIQELQHPGTTSLGPRDIATCLSLKLWDQQSDRLLTFRESASLDTASQVSHD